MNKQILNPKWVKGCVNRVLFTLAFLGSFSGCSNKMLPIPTEIPNAEYKATIAPERIQLANGLTIFLVEDRELPIVSATLMIRGGSLIEKRRGITATMAGQMREGGAGKLSGEQLDAELERLAASISGGAGQESISLSFSCLATDIDRVTELFSDVVLRPRFDENRLSLWRAQALESIRRRTDEPWTVAGIGFQQLIFGNTPYGSITDSNDVRAMTRTQLVELHKRAITPAGSFLAVSGAISKERLLDLLEKNFKDWNGKVKPGTPPIVPDTTLPQLTFKPKPGIYFVELPLSQASVFIGQQGVPRLTPDYPSIEIFNEIFGSGFFGSRLMKTVRTQRGLAYGIFGGIGSGPTRGKAAIAFQTKTESVNEAIEASIGELLKLRSNLVTEEELLETKSAIANAFVFKFDSVDEVAQRAATLEFLNYPSDYDQTYLSKIRSVTPEEIQQVAQSRWDLNDLVVLVVGNRKIWDTLPELNNYAPLSVLPIKKLKFDEVLR